jgi:uncharacterized Tic20 family protein
MDDGDQVTGNGTPDDIPADHRVEGDGVPVPSRIRDAVERARQRVGENVAASRDVVREYEERYHGHARQRLSGDSAGEEVSGVYVPTKTKRRHDPASVDENERKWAALAHASTLLTALVGMLTGGVGVLITMFVPLLIYFSFRKRSEFVAFHALQAFTIQLIGTVGWLALIVVGTVVALALLFVSILLIIILVGFILAPLVLLGFVLFLVGSFLLPLGMVIYSMIATVETWSGHDYRYPYIADWVDSQLHSTAY